VPSVRFALARLHRALAALAFLPVAAAAQVAPAEYAQRRERLAAGIGDGVVLALGAPEPEEDYLSFFQSSRFLYLTGVREPNAALVMVKRGSDVRSLLFVDPRDPATEVWSGRRMGPEGAARATGIPARDAGTLSAVLDSLLASGGTLWVVGEFAGGNDAERPRSRDEQFVQRLAARRSSVRVRPANMVVDRLRGTKSPAELELIRKAVAITVEAHREAMRFAEPGVNEFELQALIEYTFRRNGADRPGFATIVGSGPNSTTLHYNADDRFTLPGEVIVMDIGASYRGYSADVTRTIPVSGTFTPEQRAIYQIVRDAQAAAERQAKPGARAQLMMDSSSRVVARGLAQLGLIERPDATYDCEEGGQRGECPQFTLFYMHGLGHGIGLDVHDPEQYYFDGTIAAGSAFTLEPGIYVRENLLDILPETPRNRALVARIRPAVERYRSIGVRIEDDYIVTAQGVEWISRAPREIDEVEAAMREPWTGPAPRRPELVEWYRATEPAGSR
jgi:Xaa-Pro aminopeptidase